MARVKRAVNAHKKRREVLEKASGYRGQRSRLYRKAKEQLLHSATYEYRDRKKRKGDFRQLWITRINAAARLNDMTYSRLMQGLKAAGVEVDRKVLADLAVTDAAAVASLVEVARAALPTTTIDGTTVTITTLGSHNWSRLSPTNADTTVLRDGSRGEVWTFDVDPGDCFAVAMESDHFVPYLSLRRGAPFGT